MFLPPMKNDDAKNRVSSTPLPPIQPSAVPDRDHLDQGLPPLSPDVPQGDDLYLYVLTCLDKGSSAKDVRQQMIAFGYTADEAEQVVAEVIEWRRQNPTMQVPTSTAAAGNAGGSDMLIGGIVCLVGLVVTLGTFMAASGAVGGSYIVAWGAIIWGAIQFFRGAAKSGQARETAMPPASTRSDSRDVRL